MTAATSVFKALFPSVDRRPAAGSKRPAGRRQPLFGVRPPSTASTSLAAPKRTGSSAGRPVSASAAAIAGRAASSSSAARVERDGDDARRPRGQREPLVQLDELAQRRDRVRPAARALDLGAPGLVAEHEQVRDAAVVEPERHAGVDRMDERALALDPEQLAARAARPRRGAARRRRR